MRWASAPPTTTGIHSSNTRKSKTAAVAVALLLIVFGWRVADSPADSHSLPAASAMNSIAVLPFVDMSEGHDQGYFSDGIAEEILNRLAQSGDLRVIARTSSFSLRVPNRP